MNQNIFHRSLQLYFSPCSLWESIMVVRHTRSAQVRSHGKQTDYGRPTGFGLGYIGTMTVYAKHLFTWTDIFLPNLDRWISVLASMSSILLLWWVQSALDVTFNINLHGIPGGDG